MLVVLQLLLLLCVGSSVSQNVLTPTVNIVDEIEKLKKMEEKIQTLQETLNNVLSNNEALKSLVQDSQSKLESFQKEKEAMKSLVQDSQTQKIAFSAGLLASGYGDTGPYDLWETLVFKKVITNIGNAYNSNTGIFTAPEKGVYYFRFHLYSHAGNNLGASLLKNDVKQCSVLTWKTNIQNSGSNGVVLKLETGDQVNIKLWGNTVVHDNENGFVNFSGFLIFPL